MLPWIRRSAIALAALVGVGLFAGVAYDRATASTLLPGMRIDGVTVGGMTSDQAIAALAAPAEALESRPVTIEAGNVTWSMTAAGLGASVDVSAAVADAFGAMQDLGFVDRLMRRLSSEPFDAEIALSPSVDVEDLGAWVRAAAERVDSKPSDASFDLVDGSVVLHPAVAGRSLDRRDSVAALQEAISSGADSVELPVTESVPSEDGTALGKTIVVDISDNTLVLYDGTSVEREYRVATGAPGYPTPLGSFQVIRKAENPTWVNPDPEGWGKDYPASIGPGPGNPLGTRALYLDAPGIRIHGTYNSSSIGTFASHGCVRMLITDSEALYPLVPVGTRVFIVA